MGQSACWEVDIHLAGEEIARSLLKSTRIVVLRRVHLSTVILINYRKMCFEFQIIHPYRNNLQINYNKHYNNAVTGLHVTKS